MSGEGPDSGPLRMLPGAGLPLTAGALPRHRRVWGDPRPLRRWHLHQPDRELPVRVPRRLPLRRRAAGLRRCHLPDLPSPGWEAASPPRALRTCHLSAISLSFPFCRMGLMPVRGLHPTSPLSFGFLPLPEGVPALKPGAGCGAGFQQAGLLLHSAPLAVFRRQE